MSQAVPQPVDPTEPSDALVQDDTPAPKRTRQKSIAHRAMYASVFTLIEKFGLQGLRFASNIVLAWLLAPQAFGLMAMVNSVKGVLTRISDLGIQPAVVQHPRGEEREFLDTAWTMQLTRGLVLGLIVAALGYPLAYWIPQEPQPELLWLAPLAGLITVLTNAQTTRVYALQRRLDVKLLMKLELGCNLLGTAAMLVLAWLTGSVIALVLGGIIAASISVIAAHYILPGHKNRIRFDKQAGKEIWSFGKWVALSSILTALAVYSDKILMSAVVSIELVGVYSIAWGLATQPVEILLPLGRKVVFPALCRAIDAGKDLKTSVARCKAPVLVSGAWAIAVMMVMGPSIIRGAYDIRYEQAQWMVPMTAFAGWVRILASTNGSALMAVAKPQSIAYGNLIKLVLMFILVPIGLIYAGIFGVVLALVITEVPKYIWSVVAIAKEKVDPMLLDVYATLWLVLTGYAGYAVLVLVREPMLNQMHGRVGELLAGAVASLAVTVLWILPGLWSWRAMKAVKAGVKPERERDAAPGSAMENQEPA